MTVEEYLIKEKIYPHIVDPEDCPKVRAWMIEFAKIHVKKALNAAAENVTTYNDPYLTEDGYVDHKRIDQDSILNAYSLENIK